ncbi:MAG: hypothetical protein O9284_02445 [Steroidobacteraceae bacterium]|jgi:outer membrane lipoprotein SlyB|nr:hypothetical protein [Steroidobacteraceae bacterium]
MRASLDNARRVFRPLVALVVALTVGACATASGPVYPRHQAHSAWKVEQGRVVDVDPATIEGRRTAVGRVGGGLIGYEAGRTIGEGAGSRIAGAVGAVAGAVAGSAVEERATRQAAWAITVEIDGGRTLQVIQPDDQRFAVGERVRVYTRGGQARVGKI